MAVGRVNVVGGGDLNMNLDLYQKIYSLPKPADMSNNIGITKATDKYFTIYSVPSPHKYKKYDWNYNFINEYILSGSAFQYFFGNSNKNQIICLSLEYISGSYQLFLTILDDNYNIIKAKTRLGTDYMSPLAGSYIASANDDYIFFGFPKNPDTSYFKIFDYNGNIIMNLSTDLTGYKSDYVDAVPTKDGFIILTTPYPRASVPRMYVNTTTKIITTYPSTIGIKPSINELIKY